MRYLFYILISQCTFLPFIQGQVSDYIYTNFTTRDGLPSNECYDVLQDHMGYIWVATDNGVTRFNGKTFKNYGVENGLGDLVIFQLATDHLGNIWAGGLKNEIYIYDHISDKFVPWAYNELLSRLTINKGDFIKEFTLSKDTLSIMRVEIGLVNIDNSGNYIIDSTGLNEGYEVIIKDDYTHISGITYGSYITNNISIQSKGTRHIYKIPVPIPEAYNQYRSLYHKGNVLVSLYDFTSLIDQSGVQWTRKEKHINRFKHTSNGEIIACLSDNGGVRKYININDNSYTSLISEITTSNFIEDNKGGYWITSTNKGLFYIKNDKITYLSTHHQNQYYTHITSDGHRRIFTASFDGKLSAFDVQNNEYTIFHTNKGREYFACEYSDFTNRIYATNNLKLLSFDQNYEMIDHLENLSVLDKRWVSTIKNIYFDSNKVILTDIGRDIFEVEIMDLNLIQKNTFQSKSIYRVNSLIKSNNEIIYLGDINGLHFKKEGDTTDFKLVTILEGLRIEDIEENKEGELLLATKGKGLASYNPSTDHVRYITEEDGLVSNSLEDIVYQEEGIYWVASLKGISRLDLNNIDRPLINNITTNHGLPVPDVYQLEWLGNYLYASTGLGALRIDYQQKDIPSNNPIVISLWVNNKLSTTQKLKNLNYSENSIAIEYLTLNHANANNQTYRYRINDNDWIETKQTNLTLYNLSPNRYKIEIQSQNENQLWSPSLVMNVKVNLPYWRKWWFYLLLFLIICGVIAYIFFKREQSIKQANALQEKMRLLEKSALKAQMNPHFIFNCLNSIQNYIMNNDKLEAMNYLSTFAKLIRLTLNASNQELISLNDEKILLENYLTLEKLRFKDKFTYSINYSENIDLNKIQIPPMLIQPIIENAIKHGMKDKKDGGIIEVKFAKNQDELEIIVRDNGMGFTKDSSKKENLANNHKSLGTQITRERLSKKGSIETKRIGRWTEVTIKIFHI